MVEITVDIKAEHIARGVPVNVCRCPVTLATHAVCAPALINDPNAVTTGYDEIYLHAADGRMFCTKLPREARAFITGFDIGDKVAPLSFPLPVPEWFAELLAPKEVQA